MLSSRQTRGYSPFSGKIHKFVVLVVVSVDGMYKTFQQKIANSWYESSTYLVNSDRKNDEEHILASFQ